MANQDGGLSWSDRLAIALACIGAAMALVLFLVEKTPTTVGVMVTSIGVLLTYPILHFVSSGLARWFTIAVMIALVGCFGWRVWPKESWTPALVVSHPAPPTIAPRIPMPSPKPPNSKPEVPRKNPVIPSPPEATSKTQKCETGSICNQDSPVNAPQTINNYEPKPPKVLGFQMMSADDANLHLPVEHTEVLSSFKFYTDTIWDDPKFVVFCDRPCHAYYITKLHPTVEIMPNFQRGSWTDTPNATIFVPEQKPFPASTYFIFTVASEDGAPVRILKFAPLVAPSKPQ